LSQLRRRCLRTVGRSLDRPFTRLHLL
jgi:hypothetical protein